MSRTVVYSRSKSAKAKSKESTTLSITDVSEKLDITRVTVDKWIYMDVLIPDVNERIGTRRSVGFDPAYIEKIREAVRGLRGPGHSILTAELIAKIKQINVSFGKTKKSR